MAVFWMSEVCLCVLSIPFEHHSLSFVFESLDLHQFKLICLRASFRSMLHYYTVINYRFSFDCISYSKSSNFLNQGSKQTENRREKLKIFEAIMCVIACGMELNMIRKRNVQHFLPFVVVVLANEKKTIYLSWQCFLVNIGIYTVSYHRTQLTQKNVYV